MRSATRRAPCAASGGCSSQLTEQIGRTAIAAKRHVRIRSRVHEIVHRNGHAIGGGARRVALLVHGDAILRGAAHRGHRIGDVRVAQPGCRRPTVHEAPTGTCSRSAPRLPGARILRRCVDDSATSVEEREGLLIVVDVTGGIADGYRSAAGYRYAHRCLIAPVEPVGIGRAIDGHRHIRSIRADTEYSRPAITELVVQGQRVVASGRQSAAHHVRVQLHGSVARAHIGARVHLGRRRNRDGERGVVGAAEVVGDVIGVIVAAGTGRGHAGLIAAGIGIRDARPRPIAAVALGAVHGGEGDEVIEERRIEIDAPVAEETVVGIPEVADLQGPAAVELRAHEPAQRVQALIGAAGQGAASVVHPGAVGGRGAETVIPAGALRIRGEVIVDGDPEERAATALLVHGHGLAGGADDIDHQVADEGVLHRHADREQIIHVVQRGAGRELGEGHHALEALTHIVREEHAPAEIRVRRLVPCRRVHHTIQAERLARATGERSTGSGERGRGTHFHHQIHAVGAGAAVVVGEVELRDVAAGLRVGVGDHGRRVVQHGAITEVPGAVRDVEAGCREGAATVEGDALPCADQHGVRWAVRGHGGGADAWLVTGDGGREDPCAIVVAAEDHRKAAAAVAGRGGNHLALQACSGPRAEQRRPGAVAIVNGHEIHRSRARRAQVEGEEVQRDGAAGRVGADRVGVVLVVAVAAGALPSAIEECPHAGVAGAVEDGEGLRQQQGWAEHQEHAQQRGVGQVCKRSRGGGSSGVVFLHAKRRPWAIGQRLKISVGEIRPRGPVVNLTNAGLLATEARGYATRIRPAQCRRFTWP